MKLLLDKVNAKGFSIVIFFVSVLYTAYPNTDKNPSVFIPNSLSLYPICTPLNEPSLKST